MSSDELRRLQGMIVRYEMMGAWGMAELIRKLIKEFLNG